MRHHSNQILKMFLACGLIGMLVACGGGGGAGDGSAVVDPPAAPEEETEQEEQEEQETQSGDDRGMRDARAALLDTYTDPTTYTALADIPMSGSATYDGYFAGTLANISDSVTDTLLGEMAMDVTFTSTSVTVSGDVSGFIDEDDNALTGTLQLSQGSLDRDGNPASDATLLVTAAGTLRDGAGRDLIIGTQLEGDFLETGHAAVGGNVLGSVTVDGVDQDFDGSFIGAR